jgi:hypothetical protein
MSSCCDMCTLQVDPKDPRRDLVGDWPPNDQLEVLSIEEGAELALQMHQFSRRQQISTTA